MKSSSAAGLLSPGLTTLGYQSLRECHRQAAVGHESPTASRKDRLVFENSANFKLSESLQHWHGRGANPVDLRKSILLTQRADSKGEEYSIRREKREVPLSILRS